MSHLLALVDSYKDRHGNPSDASVARAIGAATQTLSSWRRRGIRELPGAELLRGLARLTGASYEDAILPAVLRDIGYLDASSEGRGSA